MCCAMFQAVPAVLLASDPSSCRFEGVQRLHLHG
jgi:hypothetical protein